MIYYFFNRGSRKKTIKKKEKTYGLEEKLTDWQFSLHARMCNRTITKINTCGIEISAEYLS